MSNKWELLSDVRTCPEYCITYYFQQYLLHSLLSTLLLEIKSMIHTYQIRLSRSQTIVWAGKRYSWPKPVCLKQFTWAQPF